MTRMMGVVMALASEVFVLKAEVRRLNLALEESAMIDDPALEAAGDSRAMHTWLAEEQTIFAEALLRPWMEPDGAPDVRDYMSAE